MTLSNAWRLCVFCVAVAAWGQKPGATGNFRIKSDQPGATVILDGKDAGETPLVLPGLAAGKHLVKLQKDGYLDYSQEVDFKPGKTDSVFAVLVKATTQEEPPPSFPVTFDAVHYHTSGRCSGQMVIQRDVIEYRSSDGKDSFQIPVRSLTIVARDAGNSMSIGDLVAVAVGAVAQASAANHPLVQTDSKTGITTKHISLNPSAMPNPKPEVQIAGSASDPSALLPVRLETSGRKYSFLALGVREPAGPPAAEPDRAKVAGATNQLFKLANWLYRDDLKQRPKR